MGAMEAVPGYPNLHRRNDTYYLYKRVPKGLLDFYGGQLFVRRSLRTKNLNEAKVRLHKALVELDEEFELASVPPAATLSPEDAKAIAQGRLNDLVIEDMELRQDGDAESSDVFAVAGDQLQGTDSITLVADHEAASDYGMSARRFRQAQETIDLLKPFYRSALAKQDLSAVEEDIDELSEQHHIALTQGSEGWRLLARELLVTWVKYIDILEKKQKGEPFEFDVTPPSPIPHEDRLSSTPTGSSGSRTTLRDLVDAYLADPSRSASARTNKGYEVIFRTMRDVIGEDKDVKEITRADCRLVLDALINMPINAAQRFPGLDTSSLIEIGKKPDCKTLSPATINNRMINMSALFKWAVREEFMLKNPAEGLSVVDPVKGKNKRRPFTIDELNAIFSAPLYTGCTDDEAGYAKAGPCIIRRGRYWVPLVALWTGMRLGECCQLHCDDIKQIDGVWCIVIKETDDGGEWDDADRKRVKTAAGERFVPVHTALLDLGFVVFVQEQKRKGGVRLFPELKPSAEGYLSDNFSKWFNDRRRFLGKVGIAGNGAVFHSFRHNYRDAMRKAGLARDIVLALGGWSSGQTDDLYGGALNAKFLKQEIDKITYDGLVSPPKV